MTAVEPLADGTYRLEMLVNGFEETVIADYVVVALPLSALSTIHWRSEALELAMDKHVGYFDRPGHYVRATFLFQRPFWREKIATDWWMLDAFDGCCVYDESARYDYSGYGILAFLDRRKRRSGAGERVRPTDRADVPRRVARGSSRTARSCCWTAGSIGGWRRSVRFLAACLRVRAR